MKSFKAEALSKLTHMLTTCTEEQLYKSAVIDCMRLIADIPEEYSMMHRKSDGVHYEPPVYGRSSGRYPWPNSVDDEEREEDYEE